MDAMTMALQFVADGTLEIDAEGCIWRVRSGGHGVKKRRAESIGGKGYLRIVLGLPGERRTCSVQAHRLVWTALRGPIPDGLQINHRDLNKQNNRIDNLELVTCAENVAHATDHGVGPGQRTWTRAATYRGRRRLTAADIAEIKRRRANGESRESIGAAFDRTPGYIHDICRRGAGSRAP